jgi:hypothetical protein
MCGMADPYASPLSSKFAVLRCHLATIADELHRVSAFRILAEIEQRAFPLTTRLEREEMNYPPPETT